MHMLVLVITLLLMAAVAWFFVSAVRQSPEGAGSGNLASRRTPLIWGMVIVGLVVSGATLWPYPHAVSAGDDIVTVNATGAQWSWKIDVEQVPADRTVVFNAHTEDVNHGLGIYGPDGRLHVQVQAMPGYVNQVEHVFDEPGLYQVLCMEFCGVAHHDMIAEFNVVAN
ncbi:MAG: cytochrome C oxidase subunit I [Alphaproteobacteria bacterium]|nr:cytochrome C oxidase subunit I [Alphaproteobacteria bacterium]